MTVADELGRANQALKDANAELENRVAARTRELQGALDSLREREEVLRLAADAGRIGLWSWREDQDSWTADQQTLHMLGLGDQEHHRPRQLRDVQRLVDPADLDAVEALFSRMGDAAEAREAELRIRRAKDNAQRWVLCRTRAEHTSDIPGAFLWPGVLLDITDRKVAEDRQVLLREVDHRAKNALAVVQSLLRLTTANSVREFSDAVQGRVDALARAHTLLATQGWAGTELRVLLERELAGSWKDGLASQVALIGDAAVALSPETAQALAMTIHELTTNALKYGALSAPGGRVLIQWVVEPSEGGSMLRLTWTETGGPPVGCPPQSVGVGSTLVSSIVIGQLGGRIEHSWKYTGLVCVFEIPLS